MADSGFSDDEKAAMKDRAREARSSRARKGEAGRQADLDDVVAAITAMDAPDRAIAEGLHGLVTGTTELAAKTWYGMPAYARDGKVVVFFQSAAKFKARYATVGFNDAAHLDDGPLWATAFAVTEWTDAVSHRVGDLLARAVGGNG